MEQVLTQVSAMDLSWVTPVSLVVAVGAFVLHLRKDSKEDYIRMDTKLEAWRNETITNLESWRRETAAILSGIREEITCIREEMRDFHGRMCALEEKNKGK